jgi:Uma2 family endonuclease
MLIENKTHTVTEFEQYALHDPNRLLELIDGRIVEKVVGRKHGKIVLKIGSRLVAWVEKNKIQGHYGTEVHHGLEDDDENRLMPDVSFEYSEGKADSGTVIGMPDFAVEVKSPSNSYDGLRDKARYYIANGSRLVWLIYPTRFIVEVYFADGSSELFDKDQVLSGRDVLPDFEMAVGDIFDV